MNSGTFILVVAVVTAVIMTSILAYPKPTVQDSCGHYLVTYGKYKQRSTFEADSVIYLTPEIAKIYISGVEVTLYGDVLINYRRCKD